MHLGHVSNVHVCMTFEFIIDGIIIMNNKVL